MATTTVKQGARVNLKIPQGSTYKHTFHYRDDKDVPVPLSGYTGRAQFRDSVDATTTLYDSETLGDITIDGAKGDVILEIPAATTTAWTFRAAVYDLEIISPASKVTRLVKGRVRVDPEVTR